MAGAGYKLFNAYDVLTAAQVNTYLMQQTVMVFANSTARTSALSSVLAEGMVSYLQDTNTLEVYDGSAWVGATGDITALTASTGISITSPTGPVPTVAIDTAVVPQLATANTFTGGVQQITTANANTIGLIVKKTLSQTANIVDLRDESNVTSGGISSGFSYFTIGRISVGFTSAQGGYKALIAGNTATTDIVLGVRGIASQTGNLQEWQDSASTVLTSISSGGRFYSTQRFAINDGATFGAMGTFVANAAGTIGLIVKGAASQTANLQEWQNSAGTVIASVDVNGRGSFTNLRSSTATSILTVTSASSIVLTVKGAASQTANLQEWQDSAGTVLAKVDFGGFFTAPAFSTGSSLATIFEESSGGRLRLTRATAVMSNPGANIAKFYLRDGTVPGTLKFVVRAGAAGAETTILDNIPQ